MKRWVKPALTIVQLNSSVLSNSIISDFTQDDLEWVTLSGGKW